MRIGDYATARELFRESLRLARELGWTFTESVVLLNLASVAHLSGDHDGAVADARAAAKIAAANDARDLEAAAHLPLGLAQMALGRRDAARAALTRSRDLFIQNDGPHLALEPTAALGLLSLAEGDHAGALEAANEIVDHLAQGRDLDGTEEPFRIRLSCYQVLNELGDARAKSTLAAAHTVLQAHAARIVDADLRRRFLNDVAHHRAIVAAWEDGLSQGIRA
jgi:tetratricopeptide (TPR) repeat protein